MPLVSSGVENGNLRQLALDRMKDFGADCRDVRYREVGVSAQALECKILVCTFTDGGHHLDVRDSSACTTTIARTLAQGLQRERRVGDFPVVRGPRTGHLGRLAPSEKMLGGRDVPQGIDGHRWRMQYRSGIGKSTLFPRDYESQPIIVMFASPQHVYGTAVQVHSRDPKVFQHQGIGTLLMEEAERIAREEHGSGKIAVISGVGTRDYYRRLGYELEGVYMTKMLDYEE